jgi:transposase-like protein
VSYKGKGDVAFLWNVMDRKTRFLLASKLSRFRDVAGADRAFREAISNAKGSLPERIFTDGLNSYKDPIRFAFKGVEHVAKAGVSKPHATNNRIERLNGTLRERVKVQRGWKTMRTPLAEGQRIHYNFVKPHTALEGQTPAQAAGMDISLEGNRWMRLIKTASTVNATGATKEEDAQSTH